jgi:hypothetical protein
MNTDGGGPSPEEEVTNLVNPDHHESCKKHLQDYRIARIYKKSHKKYHQCPTSTNGDQKNGCGISFNILNCAARRLADKEEPAFISR